MLGFERYWDVEFHTRDVARRCPTTRLGPALDRDVGSARRGVKFANNEPYRPNFKSSQINMFHEEHRGDGVQHVALAVERHPERGARRCARAGVEFMPTPGTYYDALPERLARSPASARSTRPSRSCDELGILVDGHGRGRYLLQIFLKDSAGFYQRSERGPFFYEIIQRKGDQGFGAGNFRALFESIEREQQKRTRRI